MKNKAVLIFATIAFITIALTIIGVEKNTYDKAVLYLHNDSEPPIVLETTTETTEEEITETTTTIEQFVNLIKEEYSRESSLGDGFEIPNLNSDASRKLEESIEELKIQVTKEEKIGKFTLKNVNYNIDTGVVEKNDRIWGLTIDINYPQIENIGNKKVQDKINNELKALIVYLKHGDYKKTIQYYKDMVKFVNLEADEFNSFIEGEGKDYLLNFGLYSDYKISIPEGKYLSVMYEEKFSYGNGVDFRKYLVTFDLKTGEHLYLEDFIDKDSVLKAISDGKFEDYYGANYKPFGISKEIQALVYPEQLSYYFCRDEENIYNGRNINNFYMDEEYLYIRFYFTPKYSLNGLVVLKIKLDDVEML